MAQCNRADGTTVTGSARELLAEAVATASSYGCAGVERRANEVAAALC
jgi:hypothetical protein